MEIETGDGRDMRTEESSCQSSFLEVSREISGSGRWCGEWSSLSQLSYPYDVSSG